MAHRRSRYGKTILGEAEFERQKKIKKESRGIYGPAVTGRPKASPGAAVKELEPGDAQKSDAQLSVKELELMLRGNPHALDRQIEAEFKREEGPRRTAVRLFIDYEKKRKEGPRSQVLEYLERSIGGGEAT